MSDTEVFSFRVHSDLMDEVRALAAHAGVTNAAVVNILLRVGLKTYGSELFDVTDRITRETTDNR